MKEFKKGAPSRQDVVFYSVVGLCAVVIGVSGYALFVAPSVQDAQAEAQWSTAVYLPPEPIEPQEQTPVVQEDSPVVPTAKTEQPEVTPAPPAPEPIESVEEPAPTAPTLAEQDPIWMYPVEGEVLAPYSGEMLVFNDTMQDWRVHTGTDYAAAVGDRVHAMADGTVQEVYTDGMYGTCVTVSLPKGLTATYKGLAQEVKVQVDDILRAGDVIGTVGDSNYAESAMAPHIHVEMADANGLLDPDAYLHKMQDA